MRNGAAAPIAELLKWKERRLQSNNPFSGWGCHLPSLRGKVGMEVTDPLYTSKQDSVLQVITGHNLPIFATVEIFGKSLS